jgi:hypothetical protein
VGQVPAARTNPIGIVGDGRVAAHFLHYLARIEIPTRSWSRRVSTDAPPDALSDCSTVLLLVRDAAIVPFIEAWPALREKRLVHFSGSVGTPLTHRASARSCTDARDAGRVQEKHRRVEHVRAAIFWN